MKKEVFESQGLRGVIAYPDSYEKGKRYPLLVFLHGAGTRGSDISLIENHPFFGMIPDDGNFPFVIVVPQCSENTWFDMFDNLKRLVTEVVDYDFVDRSRVYLMGSSMGGYATWQLAMSMPTAFAAIVPICGGGMYWNAARLANVPVWAFHGALDHTVLVEESVKMVEAVNKNNGAAKLTVYPNNGHDAWSDTYSNPEVYEWLLGNVNKNDLELKDEYKESKIYG